MINSLIQQKKTSESSQPLYKGQGFFVQSVAFVEKFDSRLKLQ